MTQSQIKNASDRPPTDHERALLEELADLKAELTRARELAAWFRDEHTRTLPVVASFRRWRMGHQDVATFHEHLLGDTCGKALAFGPVVPMQAMRELNDWIARKEAPAQPVERPDHERGIFKDDPYAGPMNVKGDW